jgi:hypothetical protein
MKSKPQLVMELRDVYQRYLRSLVILKKSGYNDMEVLPVDEEINRVKNHLLSLQYGV